MTNSRVFRANSARDDKAQSSVESREGNRTVVTLDADSMDDDSASGEDIAAVAIASNPSVGFDYATGSRSASKRSRQSRSVTATPVKSATSETPR